MHINRPMDEFSATFNETHLDDHLLYETYELLNTKYSLGHKEKTTIRNFYEFSVDAIYKEFDGKSITMNNAIVELIKKKEQEFREYCKRLEAEEEETRKTRTKSGKKRAKRGL